MLVELRLGKIVREEIQHHHISDDLRLGRGEDLFDYLAKCCAEFVYSNNLENIPNLPLGFTFSFPMKQHALDVGELVTWTKSFDCSNVVGYDVVYLLKSSLLKYGMENIEVMAILNDTTGTLVFINNSCISF
jgi:hexokinase